jgi:hypothetical protein
MARPILRPASTACGLMRSLFRFALVAVVAVFLVSNAAPAATISSGVDERGNHFLTLDGPIAAGDPDRFAAAILEANDRGYRLDALRLNSPGGLMWEAMVMAVMVRWVKNMATVVRRDAKCESTCFGLFAAGHRKYVDPISNPTQIGVHSIDAAFKQWGGAQAIDAVIKQWGGAPAIFWAETGGATIWAMSRLKAINVSDAILGKIIATPPDHMTYLTIEDLQQMGVEVTDNPSSSPLAKTVTDDVWLASAVTRAEIKTDNGAVIPRGSVVATMSYMPKEDTRDSSQYSVCFGDRQGQLSVYRRCNISYHSPREGTILTARIPETALMLIEQGWSLPGWIVVEDGLHLREYADPHAPDVLAAPHNTMPGGSVVKSNSTQECKVWMGSGRGGSGR